MENLHASAVELDGKAVLIKGASGSGKSVLALKLISLGANLIADDQTLVFKHKNKVYLCAPESLPRGLEIRGIGIVGAPICEQAELGLVVDLSKVEKNRVPETIERKIVIMGYSFPFYLFKDIKEPAASIYAILKFGILSL